jgi:hypothetical protein
MISATTWIVTISILALVILLDLWLAILRRNLPTSLVEAGVWTVIYIGAALVFGFFMLPLFANQQAQQEFFAGWLTEYALSVDNIFVFIIILGHLHVKKEKQQLVLLLVRSFLLEPHSSLDSQAFFSFSVPSFFTPHTNFSKRVATRRSGKKEKSSRE